MEAKERLEKILERITYLEGKVKSSYEEYRYASPRDKIKAKKEYEDNQKEARDYIYNNAKEFIFPQERDVQDYIYWNGDLPTDDEINEIKNRVLERINV